MSKQKLQNQLWSKHQSVTGPHITQRQSGRPASPCSIRNSTTTKMAGVRQHRVDVARRETLNRRLTVPPTSPRRPVIWPDILSSSRVADSAPRYTERVELKALSTHFHFTLPRTPEPQATLESLDGIGGLGNGPPSCKAFLRKMHFAGERHKS